MVCMPTCVATLRAELAGADFVADTGLGGTSAQIRFIGRFAGKEVVWKAHLTALAATDARAPQYLDIGASPEPGGIPIRIGLGVQRIDRPTVIKAIIMVRNYKRLRVGRHEFGPYGAAARSRANSRTGE